ncbi:Niban-like protein 1 [Liparis tanakae]|uniref:Niban-like protein 1 n=1 Tax=Liparis tanakae TaxID=230148 RepID=A0A4Z2E2I7_9TELE|nr:Niban-like protein 1 [Liparis tanakae]
MESLHPELRSVIAPRLRGKLQQRQKHWMLISDALYRQVLSHTTSQYGALAEACEAQRAPLDAVLRTDMDQIISSKEHVSSKMRGDPQHAFLATHTHSPRCILLYVSRVLGLQHVFG